MGDFGRRGEISFLVVLNFFTTLFSLLLTSLFSFICFNRDSRLLILLSISVSITFTLEVN